MIVRFEKYFEYYWKNDKNYSLVSEDDQAMLKELDPRI